MAENLNFWLRVIQVDFYIPFGIFSILFVITSFFVKKDSFVHKTDGYACKLISFMGILFFLIFTLTILMVFFGVNEEQKQSLTNRMFGNYWFGFWLQPFLYVFLPQLLRFEKIRKSRIIRLVLSIFFIVSIERYVILVTSLHRDYLPSSWSMSISLWESIFGVIVKLIFFLSFIGIYYLIISQLKKLKTKHN